MDNKYKEGDKVPPMSLKEHQKMMDKHREAQQGGKR